MFFWGMRCWKSTGRSIATWKRLSAQRPGLQDKFMDVLLLTSLWGPTDCIWKWAEESIQWTILCAWPSDHSLACRCVLAEFSMVPWGATQKLAPCTWRVLWSCDHGCSILALSNGLKGHIEPVPNWDRGVLHSDWHAPVLSFSCWLLNHVSAEDVLKMLGQLIMANTFLVIIGFLAVHHWAVLQH